MLAIALTAATLVLWIPTLVLLTEIISAIARRPRPTPAGNVYRPRLAVLVPAHNESEHLIPTLTSITSQLQPSDRLVVVADNCSDDTAAIARLHGAEVTERECKSEQGKSYALNFGLRFLRQDPPEVVVVIDADCRVSDPSLQKLADQCWTTGRPAQAQYQMDRPEDAAGGRYFIAQCAWMLKTYIRPVGLDNLNLPCQLMGTGMAFPWKVIGDAEVQASLVEDLELGLTLAARRSSPKFCREAVVTSAFPTSIEAGLHQRRRWEVGSLRVAVLFAPVFAAQALLKRNVPLLVLSLDAIVPPIMLFTAVLCVAVVLGAMVLRSSSWPLTIATLNLAAVGLSLVMAWAHFARIPLRAADAKDTALHIIRKPLIYWRGRRLPWIRTDRR